MALSSSLSGGVYLNEWSFIKGKKTKNPCSYTVILHGGNRTFFDILGRYCMAIALSCVHITLFHFIARGLRVCSSTKTFKILDAL